MENYCQQRRRPLVQTRVLKLQPNCVECQAKVRRAMEKVHGVHSISIDANKGQIEVTSAIDPQELIAMAANASKRTELLWEPKPEASRTNQPPSVATSSASPNRHQHYVSILDLFDQSLPLAQVHDFVAKNRRIKHVEVVHRRSVKMTFKDADDCGRASPNGRVIPEEGNNLRYSPSPSPQRPPSSASSCCGRRESGGAAAGGPSSSPPQNYNSYPYGQHARPPAQAKPPVANVNCGDETHGCCVM